MLSLLSVLTFSPSIRPSLLPPSIRLNLLFLLSVQTFSLLLSVPNFSPFYPSKPSSLLSVPTCSLFNPSKPSLPSIRPNLLYFYPSQPSLFFYSSQPTKSEMKQIHILQKLAIRLIDNSKATSHSDPLFLKYKILKINDLLSVSLALGLTCTQASLALSTLAIQPHFFIRSICYQAALDIKTFALQS